MPTDAANLTAGLLTVPFVFRERPSALPADYRPSRRVALLLLVVNQCHGKRATLEQLHVLDWACRSAQSRELFLSCLKRGRGPDLPCVRFDPTLNRAIEWACGDGLLGATNRLTQRSGGASATLGDYRVWLASRGEQAVEVLESIPDCLVNEKYLLESTGKKFTQEFVQPFLRWELRS